MDETGKIMREQMIIEELIISLCGRNHVSGEQLK